LKVTQVVRVELSKAKALRSVAVARDGSLVAVGGDDGHVRLLNSADLRLV
jgi:hypothetical protein